MIPRPSTESLYPSRNYTNAIPDFHYGPNPSDPAFIFGRVVLRPAIDFGFAIGGGIWNCFTGSLSYINERISAISSLFPVAQAARTQGPILAHSQMLKSLGKKEAVSMNKNGQPRIITQYEYDTEEPRQKALTKLALSTGGIMSLSIKSNNLIPLIHILLNHIEENTPLGQPIDIAFMFNTAISMGNEINEWNNNFALDRAKMMWDENRRIRFAILEYRDKSAFYFHRVNTNFIEDTVESAKELTFMDGGDPFLVSSNVLQAAKEALAWSQEAKQAIILITDSELNGIQEDSMTSIYPILTYQPSLMVRI